MYLKQEIKSSLPNMCMGPVSINLSEIELCQWFWLAALIKCSFLPHSSVHVLFHMEHVALFVI